MITNYGGPFWSYDSENGWYLLDQPIESKQKVSEFKVYNNETSLYNVVSKEEFINCFRRAPITEDDQIEIESDSDLIFPNNDNFLKDIYYHLIQKETDLITNVFSFGVFKFKIAFQKDGSHKIELSGVYTEGFMVLLNHLGFRKRYWNNSDDYCFIRVLNNRMKVVTVDRMKSIVYDLLKEIKDDIVVTKNGTSTRFTADALINQFTVNHHNIFNTNTCELLRSYDCFELRDTKDASYFLFKNAIVKVDRNGKTVIPYENLGDRCVWESHILPYEFTYTHYSPKNTKFVSFIYNVADQDRCRIMAFQSGIGYLLNHYTDSSMGQAIVLYDEKPTNLENPVGGTGKGLFAQAISKLKEMAKIDGKFFDPDDKFRYQSIKETTQVAFIDDLKPIVPFTTFFSALTDGWTIERKHEKQIKLTPEQSPKLMFASNSIIGGLGTSDKRRQFVLEFSDHYSKQIKQGTEKPIVQEHGGVMFANEWSRGEWNRFYSFMLDCTQFYFNYGLVSYEIKGVVANRLIQSCGEDFAEWASRQNFQLYHEYTIQSLYNEYLEFYYGNDPFTFKQRMFTDLLKKYAAIKDWTVDKYHRGTYPNKVVAFQFKTQRR